jgi:TP901 family phage tail tape measure protein
MANLVEILIVGKNLAGPAMDSANASAKGLGGTLGTMSKIATAGLIGIGLESVKMASNFQSSTARLVTSAGESAKNIDMVRKGMLDMAGQVGVSADDLSTAMYQVESAGFHGADGLIALKAAAQGAKAEGADTTVVAKALTDVLVDYHMKASDSAKVTSQMITAVSTGKTTLQEFSGAFASIIPAASAAGISFTDVSAALAAMTNHGFTANRASANLAQALRSMLNPTKSMEGAFKEYGVSSATLNEKLNGPNGLTDAMQYLSQAATKAGKEGTPAFAAALKQLMGTAPGANAALATVGANFKATSEAIGQIGGATADAQGNVKGFADVQKTLGQQVDQLKASFDSFMIELGQKLIPIITDVVNWMNKNHDAVVLIIGAMGTLMGILVAYSVTMKTIAVVTALWELATKAAAAAQWLLNVAMDANPIGLIVLAIAGLVGAFVLLWTHVQGFRDFWIAVWHDLVQWAKDGWKLVQEAFTFFLGFIEKWWPELLAPFTGGISLIIGHWNDIVGFIKGLGSRIASAAAGMWDSIVSGIEDAYHWVVNWNMAIINFVLGMPGRVANAVSGIFDSIGNAAESAYNTVVGWIDQIIGAAQNAINKVGDVGSSILHAGGDANPLNWHFAHGGIVSAAATGGPRGGMTMVGEHGPELVRLPVGSSVLSNPDTQAALSGHGGGGGTIQLEWVGGEGGDDLMKWIRKNIRAQYGNSANSVQLALGQKS